MFACKQVVCAEANLFLVLPRKLTCCACEETITSVAFPDSAGAAGATADPAAAGAAPAEDPSSFWRQQNAIKNLKWTGDFDYLSRDRGGRAAGRVD